VPALAAAAGAPKERARKAAQTLPRLGKLVMVAPSEAPFTVLYLIFGSIPPLFRPTKGVL